MAEGSAEDDLDEYEVEEEDIYVELNGVVDPSQLYKCTVENSRVLGINTERPIFKLGNYTFAGHFQDTLGTAVFLKTGDGEEKKVDYYCHTTQSIRANRVMIYPKKNELDEERDDEFADPSGTDGNDERMTVESRSEDSAAKQN